METCMYVLRRKKKSHSDWSIGSKSSPFVPETFSPNSSLLGRLMPSTVVPMLKNHNFFLFYLPHKSSAISKYFQSIRSSVACNKLCTTQISHKSWMNERIFIYIWLGIASMRRLWYTHFITPSLVALFFVVRHLSSPLEMLILWISTKKIYLSFSHNFQIRWKVSRRRRRRWRANLMH